MVEWPILTLLIGVVPLLTAAIYSMFARRVGKMKIEAVVVCVNYSDFLAWTLPANRCQFDRLVVVTTPKDIRTQELCSYWHVKCVVTDACYKEGADFNKGAMINEGLKALDGDGWVVHMDADIWLPPRFRELINDLVLDQDGLYTIDRLMCSDFLEWLKFLYAPPAQYENEIFVHLRPFPVGVRIANKEAFYGGWMPIGFFQMWNQGKKQMSYPEKHTDAARSDVLFTLQFDRSHRHMLAEIVCVHLETKMPAVADEMGANWSGRKTPPFGVEVLGKEFFSPSPPKPGSYLP